MSTYIIKCAMKLLVHSLTSTPGPLKFGSEKVISFLILWTCDYLFMLGLKLIHVGKRNRVDYNAPIRRVQVATK